MNEEKSPLAQFLTEGTYKLPYKEAMKAHDIVDQKLKAIGKEMQNRRSEEQFGK